MTIETETSFLRKVVREKQEELEERRRVEPIEALKRRIPVLDEQWSLVRAILEGPRGPRAGGKRVQLIAEIKRKSPSKGLLIRGAFEHRAMGRTYTVGGAAGISVITERANFMGELQYLLDIRQNLMGLYPGGRPSMLRKDFLLDPYHLWEARAYGADAVLLMANVLTDRIKLRDMVQQARDLEMDALVEVRDQAELDRALYADSELIGINNRELTHPEHEIDLSTTEHLRPLIPSGKVVVSESGIHSRADVERLANVGVHGVLVGTALVEAQVQGQDVLAKMAELLV